MAAKDPFEQLRGQGFQPRMPPSNQLLHSLSFVSNIRPQRLPDFSGFSRGMGQFAEAMERIRAGQEQQKYRKGLEAYRDWLMQGMPQESPTTAEGVTPPQELSPGPTERTTPGPPSIGELPQEALPDARGPGGAPPPREMLENLAPEQAIRVLENIQEQRRTAMQDAISAESKALDLIEKRREAMRNHPQTWRNNISSLSHPGALFSRLARPETVDLIRNDPKKSSITEWVMDPSFSQFLMAGQDELLANQAFGGSETRFSMEPRHLQQIGSGVTDTFDNPQTVLLDGQKVTFIPPEKKDAFTEEEQGFSFFPLAKKVAIRQAMGLRPTDDQEDQIKALPSQGWSSTNTGRAKFYELRNKWLKNLSDMKIEVDGKRFPFAGDWVDRANLRQASRIWGTSETSIGTGQAKPIGLEEDWTPSEFFQTLRSIRREIFSSPHAQEISKEIKDVLGKSGLDESVQRRISDDLLSGYMSRNATTGESPFELHLGLKPKEAAQRYRREVIEPRIRREIVSNPDAAWERVERFFPAAERAEAREEGNRPPWSPIIQEKIGEAIDNPERYISPYPGIPGKYKTELFDGVDIEARHWNEAFGHPLPYTWNPADAHDREMMNAQMAMSKVVDMIHAARGSGGSVLTEADIAKEFFKAAPYEVGDTNRILDSRMKALTRWMSDPKFLDDPLIQALVSYYSPSKQAQMEAQMQWATFAPNFKQAMRMVNAGRQQQGPALPPSTSPLTKMTKNQY